jgi:hypothetical protein
MERRVPENSLGMMRKGLLQAFNRDDKMMINGSEESVLVDPSAASSSYTHRRHLLDIERPGSRKLGDLLIFALAEHTSHLEKHFLKTQVFIRCLVIRVKNLQHGGCAVKHPCG